MQQDNSLDQINHIRQLLLSHNESDQWIVTELFEGGGFVEELLVETMVVAKLSKDQKLRRQLAQYITRYASPALYKVFTTRQSWNIQSERKLSRVIRKATQHFNPARKRVDVWLQIAQSMYAYRGVGLQYLWHRLRQPTAVLALLREQVQGRMLDLSGKDFSFLPKAVGQLTSLEVLNLRSNPELSRLPAELGQLTQLHTLDLRGTNVYKLEVLQALPCLHTLILGYTYLYAEEITRLSQLQTLHLPKNVRLMRSAEDYTPPSPEQLARYLTKALPQLEIIWY